MERCELTFRVFVSSTFSDLKAERNALQEHVFPRLREYCQQHGARFQAIDLRWGVSEEAALDQQTMNICLEELRHCQRITPRPNFIVLLGQRYGWCPLPPQIAATEFEPIRDQITDANERSFLQDWYRRDDNAVPPEYCLQPRRVDIGDNHSEAEKVAAREAEAQEWGQVEHRLRDILLAGVNGLAWPMTDERRLKYEASATHQEILHGALEVKDSTDHVFGFFRTIRRLPKNSTARDFVDLTPQGQIDREARIRLARLKKALRRKLGSSVHGHRATWTGTGPGEDHLQPLCEGVYNRLRTVIDDELQQRDRFDPVDQEAIAHRAFGQERARGFIGRYDLLQRIQLYLDGHDRHPLVVHGVSGSGKSALLAKAVADHESRGMNHEVIVRYVGATPASSDIRSLLEGLCKEITLRYGGDTSMVPTEYTKLEVEFANRLTLAKAEKPLVVFLDALDQLSDTDHGRNLAWFPTQLPEQVRLVVSMLPGECLSALQQRQLPADHFAEVTPMTAQEGAELLAAWLHEARRTLQPRQRDEVLTKFRGCPYPLYLRLAFEEARRWTSWDETVGVMSDVAGVLGDLFDRLEQAQQHGAPLVSRALGNLAASRHGLTEDELLNVLSADNEVMADFRRRSPKTPALERLPVVVWARLFADLEPYMTQRQAGGTTVLTFYHRQVGEAATARYVPEQERPRFHDALATYFHAEADPNGNRHWQQNARLLSELPFHLAHGTGEMELRQLFSQLAFLAARTATGQVYEQIADYHLAGSPFPAPLSLWRSFLQKHAQRLKQHPTMLVALVNHEGFSEGRSQVPRVYWPRPWLRTSPEEMPTGEAQTSNGLHVEVTGNLESSWGRASAIASQAALAFSLERLGTIRLSDLKVMQETTAMLSIRRDRPLVLACAPDATSMVVFYECGKAELYRCVRGEDGCPVNSVLVAEFSFHLPESEDPVVVWHRGDYWYQSGTGTLAHISPENPHPLEEDLAAGQGGELSALVFTEDTRLIALRQVSGALLFAPGASPILRHSAHVSGACLCGPTKVAVAFTDGALVVFEVADAITAVANVEAGILRGALGWDGTRLLWLGENGRFNAWNPGEPALDSVQENEEMFPKHLHVLPRQWVSYPDSSILLGTTHSWITFRLLQGGRVSDSRLEEVFGGPVWRAVMKRGQDQWLLEGPPFREVLLGRGVMGRLYCAPDGEGRFFAASGYGPGLVFDLATLRSTPLNGCPMGINTAMGDGSGGCWFTDRAGDIYFTDAAGRCRLIAKIGLQDVHGAHLVHCGDFLVWVGYSVKYFPETGAEPARTFVFFCKNGGGFPTLERLGEQFRHPREGLCVAACYDPTTKQLVTLWAKPAGGTETYALRVGGVREFAQWQYREISVSGLGPSSFVQAALSGDSRLLGVLNRAGEFSCLSVADGCVLAVLAGSAPFTAVAPGADNSEFWLAEARASVYRCALVERPV